ncbi:uncharacterized protein LOC133779192 [Humulus lupulus]|uniref:uncharacterized protein LOC133779192 n=1 Tax=Humulus lupulus TaxID=3486 RepID=UPI002B40AE41|nr:uncharacterized protein LOC133779192 [Humulus lupulus]
MGVYRGFDRQVVWVHGFDWHIDGAKHMLRRRRQFYPGAYWQDVVVMNIMFSQVVPARYDAYQNAKEADKKRFLWDSDVISMITGIDNQFLASWKGVDTVYWCQNYLQAHWFAVEASISTWTLNVYDSDVTVISDKQLQSFMKSWSTLFPSLLLQSQLFKDDPRLTIPPGAKRCKEFNVHRMPVDSVPQTKVSGDCGVYAIKHIEHLLGRLPLDTICDDNMELFRNKWTIDLWYQNNSQELYFRARNFKVFSCFAKDPFASPKLFLFRISNLYPDMDSTNVFDLYSTPEAAAAPPSKKKTSKRHTGESNKAPQAKKAWNVGPSEDRPSATVTPPSPREQ